jgi:hypothetical protein
MNVCVCVWEYMCADWLVCVYVCMYTVVRVQREVRCGLRGRTKRLAKEEKQQQTHNGVASVRTRENMNRIPYHKEVLRDTGVDLGKQLIR